MGELRVDRWLHLVGTPAFLRPIRADEHSWRPAAALGLMLPVGLVFGMTGYLASGVINSWLIQILVLGQRPTWPTDLIGAASASKVRCSACLLGGMTETVLVGVISLACMLAVLLCAVLVYRRPAKSWITSAPASICATR